MPGRHGLSEAGLAGLLDILFPEFLHVGAVRGCPGGVTRRLLRQGTESVYIHIIGLEPDDLV